jgi:hypothetical protein
MATLDRNVTKGGFDKSGAYERRILGYTGPSSYATGGDSLTPEQCQLGMIAAVLGLVIWNGTNLYTGFWNSTTKKIIWLSATATEVTNATDLSAFTGRIEVIGK